jgi:hypothetical protein
LSVKASGQPQIISTPQSAKHSATTSINRAGEGASRAPLAIHKSPLGHSGSVKRTLPM